MSSHSCDGEAKTSSNRLRPAQRLRASADFKALLEDGHRYNDAKFTIYYRPNFEHAARLGLAVSRRVARKATHRNELKRLLRETFRSSCYRCQPLDIFVLLKPTAATVDRNELRSSVLRALENLTAKSPGQHMSRNR